MARDREEDHYWKRRLRLPNRELQLVECDLRGRRKWQIVEAIFIPEDGEDIPNHILCRRRAVSSRQLVGIVSRRLLLD